MEYLWKFVDKTWEYFLNNFCSWPAFFIGEIIAFIIAYALKASVAELASIDIILALRINTAFFSLTWLIFWAWNRRMPKARKNKVGIVVAIEASGQKEKIDLLNDFKTRLEDLSTKESLSEIDLVLLNEYYSKKVVKRLRRARKDGDLKAQIQIAQKTRGRLLVFGEVKDRIDGVEKCFLNMDAVVAYPRNQRAEEHIKDGFANLWQGKLCFEKNREFLGFQITADIVFHAARYVIGMAFYAAGNVNLARKFHESLYKDQTFSSIKAPNILHIRNKLKALLSEENWHLAHNYYKQENLIEAKRCLEQSLVMQETYSGYLLQSNIIFAHKSDPIAALESVRKAKDMATIKDGAWRYNKAFLMAYRGKYPEALKVYKQIINPRNSYEGEEYILNQVYEFNEKYILNNPDKPWPHFIIGYLKYKKENIEVEAYESFEKFIKEAHGKPEFKEFLEVAEECAAEIKKGKWD